VIKSRRMRWAGTWHAWREISADKILVGKLDGRRQLGRPDCRRENIEMVLKIIGCECGLVSYLRTGTGGGGLW